MVAGALALVVFLGRSRGLSHVAYDAVLWLFWAIFSSFFGFFLVTGPLVVVLVYAFHTCVVYCRALPVLDPLHVLRHFIYRLQLLPI